MVFSVMQRDRCTAHSSFCSKKMAPTNVTIASSLGKTPTTSARGSMSRPKQFV